MDRFPDENVFRFEEVECNLQDFDALFGSNAAESDALPCPLGMDLDLEGAASSTPLQIFDIAALEHVWDSAVDVGILEGGVSPGLTGYNYDATVNGGFRIGHDSAQPASLSTFRQRLIDNPEVSYMPATSPPTDTFRLHLMSGADDSSIPGCRDSFGAFTTELTIGTLSQDPFDFTNSAVLEESIHLNDVTWPFTLPQPEFPDHSNEAADIRDRNSWQDLGSNSDQPAATSFSLRPAAPSQHGNDMLGTADTAISIAATKLLHDNSSLESSAEFVSSLNSSIDIANLPLNPKRFVSLQNISLGRNNNCLLGSNQVTLLSSKVLMIRQIRGAFWNPLQLFNRTKV